MLLLLWLFLCFPWLLLAADTCKFHQSPLNVSSMLDSLHCYNDYKSHFNCTWKEDPKSDPNRSIQLWFYMKKITSLDSLLCEDLTSDVKGTRKCRYNTNIFSTNSNYKAFFKGPRELCPSIQPTRHDLSLLMRAQAPVNVSTSSTNDTGRLITWSSPYPPASALNDNINYQVNYRTRGHDEWTTKQLNETQIKLDKEKRPGHVYEARVRARVFLLGHWSQWSHWSPIVSWLDPEQEPRVDCELSGEREARCSWEQSIELSHFISYQLVCHPEHTDTPRTCCEDPAVSPGHRKDTVKLSCLLPLTSTLRIELVPKQNNKVFNSILQLRPDPPTQVNVKQEGDSWFLEWTPAEVKDYVNFAYQVRYDSQQNEKDTKTFNSSEPKFSISALSLNKSHTYWFKVGARVVKKDKVTPSDWSDWSDPVNWTSPAAAKTVEGGSSEAPGTQRDWIYAFVGFLVPAVFITFFIVIVPACRQRVVLWVQSIPSPKESNVIQDIQTAYICKVMDMDRMSTCSTIVSVRPKERLDTQTGEAEDEGICSWPLSPLHKSLSFDGPYIFCQDVESKPTEEDISISEQTEPSCPAVACPQSKGEYVRLPSPAVTTSTQCLSPQSNSSTEGDQHFPTQGDTAEVFWPQGGATQGSGYCQLPTDFTQTQT